MQEAIFGMVDIGSNTVHLLVARSDGRNVTPLVDESAGLRLGGDVDRAGGIGPAKLEELLATLGAFQVQAAAAGASRLRLLATEAIRAAGNRAAVCAAVQAATGLPVTVLAPAQEAALAFLGTSLGAQPPAPKGKGAHKGAPRRVVVDIGGGSMQVVVGAGETVAGSVSLPLGAAHVARRFLPRDPPSAEEAAVLVVYLAEVIAPALPLRTLQVTRAVGVGGTLRRLPQLLGQGLGERLPAHALDQATATLEGRPAAELVVRYGLDPPRAPLLLPAVLILREVLRGYGDPPLTISAYGLREGAILALARGGLGDGGDGP